ncbi:hypothetical protein C8Q80DRAFT_916767 [Daedaleopsis nitida]|nr:hypothetical protein C8Q80DRAFT_916767 [Daedaleopsis nitida]
MTRNPPRTPEGASSPEFGLDVLKLAKNHTVSSSVRPSSFHNRDQVVDSGSSLVSRSPLRPHNMAIPTVNPSPCPSSPLPAVHVAHVPQHYPTTILSSPHNSSGSATATPSPLPISSRGGRRKTAYRVTRDMMSVVAPI